MNKLIKDVGMLVIALLLCIYLGEILLGFYLVKSVARYPLPPYAVQKHVTMDYDVTYQYSNYGLRSPDYHPGTVYDAVLLGDSFFFGQGVVKGKTIAGKLAEKGLKLINVSEIATNPIDYFHKLNVMQAQGLRSRAVVVGLCLGNDFRDIADKDIAPALSHRYHSPFLDYDAGSFLTLERLRYQLARKIQQLRDWTYNRLSSGPVRETVVVHEFEHRRKFDPDWLRFFTGNRPELMAAMAGSIKRPLDQEKLSEEAYLEKIQLTPRSFDQTVRILQEMPGRLPAARFFLVLIPGPHYVWGLRSGQYDGYVGRLKAALSPFFYIIDLHGQTTPAMHFPHDGHWNEAGHYLVAELLFPCLSATARQPSPGR